MPPEALEFVKILLDLAGPSPRTSAFHQADDELFDGERRFTLIEGGPGSGPVRR